MIRVPPLIVEAFAAAVSVLGSPVNLVWDMPNQAMTLSSEPSPRRSTQNQDERDCRQP